MKFCVTITPKIPEFITSFLIFLLNLLHFLYQIHRLGYSVNKKLILFLCMCGKHSYMLFKKHNRIILILENFNLFMVSIFLCKILFFELNSFNLAYVYLYVDFHYLDNL